MRGLRDTFFFLDLDAKNPVGCLYEQAAFSAPCFAGEGTNSDDCAVNAGAVLVRGVASLCDNSSASNINPRV